MLLLLSCGYSITPSGCVLAQRLCQADLHTNAGTILQDIAELRCAPQSSTSDRTADVAGRGLANSNSSRGSRGGSPGAHSSAMPRSSSSRGLTGRLSPPHLPDIEGPDGVVDPFRFPKSDQTDPSVSGHEKYSSGNERLTNDGLASSHESESSMECDVYGSLHSMPSVVAEDNFTSLQSSRFEIIFIFPYDVLYVRGVFNK